MHRSLICLASLLLVGCIETNVGGGGIGDGLPGDGTDDGGASGEIIDGELCNNRDDDGDGEIDEGWPDTDGDGWPDCLEQDCEVRLPQAVDVRIDPLCVEEPWFSPESPWDVVVEWHREVGDGVPFTTNGVVVMPAVGNLTDDNGDGFVDDRDVPEIAYTAYFHNRLEVVSGDTGELLFSLDGVLGTAGVAIADVDSDGDNEVIALANTPKPSVIAVDRHGNIKWQSEGRWNVLVYATPVVADLDADGDVEIVADRLVVDGKTGAILAELPVREGYRSVRSAVLGDVDLDGQQEILLAADRFDMNGNLEWRNDFADLSSVHVAIADIDGDPQGEILMISGDQLEAFDPGGTRLYAVTLPGTNGGPPCVADFDGDGQVEVGLGVGDAVGVYELDGTTVWEVPSVDSTRAHAGCSGYDFDGDGAYELLHADMHTFYILDGRTGAILYADPRHTSTTLFEYPVVADVDNDGAAEIVLASNTNEDRLGWAGITVLGHRDDGWARSGPTWGVHDFAVTNLEGDGTVPTVPFPPWQVHNVFRARPTVDSPAMANLQVKIEDVCVGTCEGGPVKVSYVVTNRGGAPVRPGTRLNLFVMDGFERRPIAERLLPAIKPGQSLPGDFFELDPDQLADGLLLLVDDDGNGRGWVEECHEDDNMAAMEDRICGGRD